MIDLHCHLLPGVDDGAASLDESCRMAERLADLGYSDLCCTPHIPWSTFVHTGEELDALRGELGETLAARGVALRLHAGAEHHSSVVPELLDKGQLVLYPRGDSFLMEFPFSGLPARVEDLLFRLQVKGIQPLIAHVERYPEIQRDLRLLSRYRERGARISVNLASLAGGWDRAARTASREVLRAGLADALTTDLHSTADLAAVIDGLAEAAAIVGQDGLAELCERGPARIAGIGPGDEP
ncbi:MAG: hypothetical protein JXR96_10545 [Deltaproteobacteria bacterium]|nr:hypothetical protein [Deltaproteobacteria bacterium]